jgi:hypothetical protein
MNSSPPSSTGVQPVDLKPTDPKPFEIDITRANTLLSEWAHIAKSIARQCKWRPQGKCLKDCQGLAVCNLDGLTLVDAQGRPLPAGGLTCVT